MDCIEPQTSTGKIKSVILKESGVTGISCSVVTYFDFAFILLCAPFRFVGEEKSDRIGRSGNLKLRTCFLQLVFFLLVNLFGTYTYLRDIIDSIKNHSNRRIEDTFHLFIISSRLVFTLAVFKTFCFKRYEIIKIVDLLENEVIGGIRKTCLTKVI